MMGTSLVLLHLRFLNKTMTCSLHCDSENAPLQLKLNDSLLVAFSSHRHLFFVQVATNNPPR